MTSLASIGLISAAYAGLYLHPLLGVLIAYGVGCAYGRRLQRERV